MQLSSLSKYNLWSFEFLWSDIWRILLKESKISSSAYLPKFNKFKFTKYFPCLASENWRISVTVINFLSFNPQFTLPCPLYKNGSESFFLCYLAWCWTLSIQGDGETLEEGVLLPGSSELTQQAPPARAACLLPGFSSVVASAASGSWCTCSFQGTQLLQCIAASSTQHPAVYPGTPLRWLVVEYLQWDTSLWSAFSGTAEGRFPVSSTSVARQLPCHEPWICPPYKVWIHPWEAGEALPWVFLHSLRDTLPH